MTDFEWLEKHHPTIYQRVCELRIPGSNSGSLLASFIWKNSLEGHDFWSEVRTVLHMWVFTDQEKVQRLNELLAMGKRVLRITDLEPADLEPAVLEPADEELWWQKERREAAKQFERMIALRNDVRRIIGI